MTARVLSLVFLLSALAGCGDDDSCPSGTSRVGDACEVLDAGSLDGGDAEVDAEVDSGPSCAEECGGARPHCHEGACVACVVQDDCSSSSAPHCSTSNECVECVSNAHCAQPSESACRDGACSACVSNADCAHLTSTSACSRGTCVECVSNADCTAANTACDTETNTCVSITPGSLGPCQPCIADAQCRTGQLCVPMTFRGTAYGNYCAWRRDAPAPGPAGNCFSRAPYVNEREATSIDGMSVSVCTLRTSTCDAHADFSETVCTPGATVSEPNDACGVEGLDDGFCRPGAGRCTVGCSSSDDCPCTTGACTSRFACTDGFCSLST